MRLIEFANHRNETVFVNADRVVYIERHNGTLHNEPLTCLWFGEGAGEGGAVVRGTVREVARRLEPEAEAQR